MEKSQLLEIVQEQRQELNSATTASTQRLRFNDVLAAMKLPHVIAITGMRRSGKSTLMQQVLKSFFKDNFYYLDFEDERLIDFQVNDFNLLYEIFLELYGEQKVFFFDEIQVVAGWESYIRRMYKSGNKFIITGSSAELLSSELSTKLTGRHIAIELLPFSFQEYLTFSNIEFNLAKPILTKERGLLKQALNKFIKHGGIPEYLKYQDNHIIKTNYENILYKDVIVRYDIKAVKAMRELSLWLLSNPGALISNAKLKNILQLGSVNTVKNYIHYLESAYLIFTVDKYCYSVGTQTSAQKKVYSVDTGLMEVISFQFSENSGKYLENIVYLELRRHYDSEIYYYKTEGNLEVDFCLRKGRTITTLIQVAEYIGQEKTRARELNALIKAMAELKLNNGIIITLDHAETLHSDGKTIEIIPLTKWLLNPK